MKRGLWRTEWKHGVQLRKQGLDKRCRRASQVKQRRNKGPQLVVSLVFLHYTSFEWRFRGQVRRLLKIRGAFFFFCLLTSFFCLLELEALSTDNAEELPVLLVKPRTSVIRRFFAAGRREGVGNEEGKRRKSCDCLTWSVSLSSYALTKIDNCVHPSVGYFAYISASHPFFSSFTNAITIDFTGVLL